jgi:hypothetical protein
VETSLTLMVTALAMFRTSNWGYQAPAKSTCICRAT